jgi:predicted DNA-binding protein (MmcQ/YjbR family)
LTLDSLRNHCIAKKGVTEELPFGPDTLVFKVMGKMFALTGADTYTGVNLKVDPEKGAELREQYEAVKEAYHMNKKHWITVEPSGVISDRLIYEWIDESYFLVVRGLTKSQKSALESM